jgi:hypothetical protein
VNGRGGLVCYHVVWINSPFPMLVAEKGGAASSRIATVSRVTRPCNRSIVVNVEGNDPDCGL